MSYRDVRGLLVRRALSRYVADLLRGAVVRLYIPPSGKNAYRTPLSGTRMDVGHCRCNKEANVEASCRPRLASAARSSSCTKVRMMAAVPFVAHRGRI